MPDTQTPGERIAADLDAKMFVSPAVRSKVLAAAIDKALAEARDALDAYGQHWLTCPQSKLKPWAHSKACDCGLDTALANGTAALAAHDESVQREALESAADAWAALEIIAMSNGNDLPDVVEWLRERAKGGSNG